MKNNDALEACENIKTHLYSGDGFTGDSLNYILQEIETIRAALLRDIWPELQGMMDAPKD